MLSFSQVLKPIKWQDLFEEGKNGCNAFRTGAKIYLSKKIYIYFRVRGTLKGREKLSRLPQLGWCGSAHAWNSDHKLLTFVRLPSSKLIVSMGLIRLRVVSHFCDRQTCEQNTRTRA